jgi:hypothetical protein
LETTLFDAFACAEKLAPLPLLLFLSGKVLYWIWFDNVYAQVVGCDVEGGLALATGASVVAVWALGSWCSQDIS